MIKIKVKWREPQKGTKILSHARDFAPIYAPGEALVPHRKEILQGITFKVIIKVKWRGSAKEEQNIVLRTRLFNQNVPSGEVLAAQLKKSQG